MVDTTTAQWIEAIGAAVAAVFGGGSLLIAFGILLRDRARAQAAQAAQIACWRHWPPTTEIHGHGAESGSGTIGQTRVETDEVHLHNASDRPITDVGVRTRKMTKGELRKAFPPAVIARFPIAREDADVGFSNGLLTPPSPAYAGVIMPGEVAMRDMTPLTPDAAQYCRRWATFRDVNGVSWLRDLSDGRLLKAGSLRATLRLRRGMWSTTLVCGGREGYRWWTNG